MEIDKNISNSKFLLTDIIQGDEKVSGRPDFENLTNNEITDTLNLILKDPSKSEQQKKYYLANLWRIYYKQKPPTIEDFLTPEWIGPTALNLYPHVQKILKTFWNPNSFFRHLILAPSIGFGKSTLTAISILYVFVHLNLMKNPKKFFGTAEANPYVAVLGSFTIQKAKQVLLAPFYEILQTSAKFRRVIKEERVNIAQEEEYNSGSNKIVWTRASHIGGQIQFSNDLHLILSSSIGSLLGVSIITGALSEISFFLNEGISAEEINQMYSDLKGRIWSRFGERYFATTVIDSSPNDFNSPIDKYVFSGDAEKNPRNYVVKSTHWDAFKDLKKDDYKQWLTTGKTFPIFRGTGTKSPSLLSEEEIKLYSATEIFNVPIDLLHLFKSDLKKSIKDYCGWPSGGPDKLIEDLSIIDNMFSEQLKNIYGYIQCPANINPEKMIWEKIKNNFFIEVGKDHYEFYRSPREKRWLAIDLSESGDMSSISCVHPEITKEGQIIIVGDFTLAIVPGQDRINLQAIEKFILDLKKYGKFHISKVTYDRYQSSSSIQNLKREEIEASIFSVDIDMTPYLVFISWLKNGRIKSGKNIFLKNNLKSLQEIYLDSGKKKIDHLKGRITYDDGLNWNNSVAGLNAKDISDSFASASFQCINEITNYIPRYQWVDDEINETDKNKNLKEKVLNNIYSKYSFLIRENEENIA